MLRELSHGLLKCESVDEARLKLSALSDAVERRGEEEEEEGQKDLFVKGDLFPVCQHCIRLGLLDDSLRLLSSQTLCLIHRLSVICRLTDTLINYDGRSSSSSGCSLSSSTVSSSSLTALTKLLNLVLQLTESDLPGLIDEWSLISDGSSVRVRGDIRSLCSLPGRLSVACSLLSSQHKTNKVTPQFKSEPFVIKLLRLFHRNCIPDRCELFAFLCEHGCRIGLSSAISRWLIHDCSPSLSMKNVSLILDVFDYSMDHHSHRTLDQLWTEILIILSEEANNESANDNEDNPWPIREQFLVECSRMIRDRRRSLSSYLSKFTILLLTRHSFLERCNVIISDSIILALLAIGVKSEKESANVITSWMHSSGKDSRFRRLSPEIDVCLGRAICGMFRSGYISAMEHSSVLLSGVSARMNRTDLQIQQLGMIVAQEYSKRLCDETKSDELNPLNFTGLDPTIVFGPRVSIMDRSFRRCMNLIQGKKESDVMDDKDNENADITINSDSLSEKEEQESKEQSESEEIETKMTDEMIVYDGVTPEEVDEHAGLSVASLSKSRGIRTSYIDKLRQKDGHKWAYLRQCRDCLTNAKQRRDLSTMQGVLKRIPELVRVRRGSDELSHVARDLFLSLLSLRNDCGMNGDFFTKLRIQGMSQLIHDAPLEILTVLQGCLNSSESAVMEKVQCLDAMLDSLSIDEGSHLSSHPSQSSLSLNLRCDLRRFATPVLSAFSPEQMAQVSSDFSIAEILQCRMFAVLIALVRRSKSSLKGFSEFLSDVCDVCVFSLNESRMRKSIEVTRLSIVCLAELLVRFNDSKGKIADLDRSRLECVKTKLESVMSHGSEIEDKDLIKLVYATLRIVRGL